MASKKNKTVVFDLDDLCDQWDIWDKIHEWREATPNGKVTLFAIPRRISDGLLKRYLDLPWVEVAMHGWHHARWECLYWTWEDAEEKMKRAADRGFVRGFKAPGWVITPEVYEGARKAGFWVADHSRNVDIYGDLDVPTYVYNDKKSHGVIAAHGHTHNVCDNGLEEAYDRFLFPESVDFKFVSEVVK